VDRIENDESNNSSILASVFVAAVTFIPSIYLSTMGGYTCTQTNEMGSGAMIYISSFITIDSAIQKLRRGIHRHTDSMVIS
jgi:ABC-type glycerol-3-phosphate transport system permease component